MPVTPRQYGWYPPLVTYLVIFWAQLLSSPASADTDGICHLPNERGPREQTCPQLAEHLRAWRLGGSPPPLCEHGGDPWRRCRLRRDGLLTPTQLSQAESPDSAVLASRYFTALLADGAPEPAARAAALAVAGIPPAPRLVQLALPPLTAPPTLPSGDRRAPCLPAVTLTADGALSFGGKALSTDTAVEARLWTVLPALASALPAPSDCAVVDIWADEAVTLDAVVPVAETLYRAGYRARLLARLDGSDSPYSALVGVRLRLAPGGAAHPEAVPLSPGEAIDLSADRWTGRVHLSRDQETTVADLMAVSRAADGDAVLWLSTTRDALTSIDESVLIGELLLPGTPAARTLRRQLDRQLPQLTACTNKALTRQPSLAGALHAELSIADGVVTSARLSSAEITDAGLLSCVSEVLEGLSLEVQEPVVVGYTVTLRGE